MKRTARHAPGRAGVLDIALKLFARDGISGVSLQQIADELCVTKAAVYHHFSTKSKIVRAVLQPGLEILAEAVAVAERTVDPSVRQRQVIRGLADCIATNRRAYQIMLSDPYATRVLTEDTDLAQLFATMRKQLAGDSSDQRRRLAVSCFLGACLGPCGHPEFEALDGDQLREVILDLGQRLLVSP